MEPVLRHAIARIDIMRDGKSTDRGTGFLVGPGLVLTAMHVVANRRSEALELLPGTIRLTFPEPRSSTPGRVETLEMTAQADPEQWDRFADWILLRCDDSRLVASPLPMADLRVSGDSWSTFGFPQANPRDGMVQSGTVESHAAPFEKVTTYQLFSKQAAAGNGAPAPGLSGGPVIMQGAVVGLLRAALMVPDDVKRSTAAGTLYACRIQDVLDRCGASLPAPVAALVVAEDLSFRDQDRLRKACGIVYGGNGVRGTGYLIDGNLVMTSAQVVASAGAGATVTIEWPGLDVAQQTTASVARIDAETNCAVLQVSDLPAQIAPLALDDCPNGRVLWQGYGFPVSLNGESLPLSGVVREIGARPGTPLKLAFDQDSLGAFDAFDGLSGSPVMVNGSVIGQISHPLLKPLAAATTARDGRPPLTASEAVTPVPAPLSAEAVQSAAGDDDAVVVSYAAPDTRWAQQLADRLAGLGLRPFMDMLPPAEASRNARDGMVARAPARVIVLSQAWLDGLASPAFRDSAPTPAGPMRPRNANLVAARVDVCDLPPDWAALPVIDFTDRRKPNGPRLVDLYAALKAAVAAPALTAATAEMESRVTDHLLRYARTAVRAVRVTGDARTLVELYKQWQSAGVLDPAVTYRVAESLIQVNHPAQALTLLDGHNGSDAGVRGDQLRALALGKMGLFDESIAILVRLRDSGQLDAETGGILGGRYKQQWQKTGSPRFLQSAAEVYREAFERTGDSYPGINAAALALQLKQLDEAASLATRVIQSLRQLPEATLDHWQLATLGEAYLLSGDLSQAKTWYGKAVTVAAGAVENIAIMRKQARLNLTTLGQPAGALDDVLAVPRVAAFAGHMVDAPERTEPRFPSNKVGKVRLAIRASLAKHQIEVGFASAAGGSDLLFLEELLERGGRAWVFLPFPKDDFVRTSVGPKWAARFTRVVEHPKVVVKILMPVCPPLDEQPAAFAACNEEFQRQALEFARGLDEQPILLSVSAGTADGAGGTLEVIRAWEDRGLEFETIDPARL